MRAHVHKCSVIEQHQPAGMIRRPVSRRIIRCIGIGKSRERTQLLTIRAAIPGPLYLASSPSDRMRLNAASNFPSSFVPFPLRYVTRTRINCHLHSHTHDGASTTPPPKKNRDDPSAKRTPPLVRVRLSVEYRVHSRQMLCVGGSAIPFGWSFLSIAKVPMSWQPTDIWVVDVELPAGCRVEYKYVILEEQDWTRQVNESAEGRVEYTYRVAPDDTPPDVQHITRQMAIVAWQSGSNRVLQVPDENEIARLVERGGDAITYRPSSPAKMASSSSSISSTSTSASSSSSSSSSTTTQRGSGSSGSRSYGQQALGGSGGRSSSSPTSSGSFSNDSNEPEVDDSGVWEQLSIDESGRPFLERRDVWGRGESPSRW